MLVCLLQIGSTYKMHNVKARIMSLIRRVVYFLQANHGCYYCFLYFRLHYNTIITTTSLQLLYIYLYRYVYYYYNHQYLYLCLYFHFYTTITITTLLHYYYYYMSYNRKIRMQNSYMAISTKAPLTYSLPFPFWQYVPEFRQG